MPANHKENSNDFRLPVVLQKDLNTVLYQALPLCAILARPNLLPWYYENFIEIYYTDCYTVRGDYQYAGNGFRFPAVPCRQVLKIREQYDTKTHPDIIRQLLDAIHQGYYAYIQLNENHIPTQGSYRRRDFLHDSLLYGYNTKREIFYGITIDAKRNFTMAEFPFDATQVAYLTGLSLPILGEAALDPQSLDRGPHLTYFKVNEKTVPYEFRLSVFATRLSNYVNACANPEFDYFFHCDPVKPIYGIEIYRTILDFYRNERELDFQDFRNFHFLYEHKAGILRRLQYIAMHWSASLRYEELIARYTAVRDSFNHIRLIVLKRLHTGVNLGPHDPVLEILLAASHDERYLLYEICLEIQAMIRINVHEKAPDDFDIFPKASVSRIRADRKSAIAKLLPIPEESVDEREYQILRLWWKKEYPIHRIAIRSAYPLMVFAPKILFEPLTETQWDEYRTIEYKEPRVIRSLYLLFKAKALVMDQIGIVVREKGLSIGAPIRASSTYRDESGGEDPKSKAQHAIDGREDTFWNAESGKGAGEFMELNFKKPIRFNRIVLRQRPLFDRITGYRLLCDGKDGEWIELYRYKGERIGHKEIVHHVQPVVAQRIRLLITDTEPDHLGYVEAAISGFEIYYI
jgi:hypothetical protein